jgi:uncharacterized membrane protein (DUF106 family)
MTQSDSLTKSFKFLEYSVIGSVLLCALIAIGGFLWIQHSRVDSCHHNYQAFNEVFRPFRKNAPPTTIQRLDQVHKTVAKLQAHCNNQVGPFAW